MYRFTFYYIYRSLLNSKSVTPVTTSAMIIGVLMVFVFSLLDFVIDKLFGVSFFDYVGKTIYIIGFIFLMVLNIVFVYTKNRFQEIISHYENQSDDEHRKNSRVLLIVIVILFLLTLAVPFLR